MWSSKARGGKMSISGYVYLGNPWNVLTGSLWTLWLPPKGANWSLCRFLGHLWQSSTPKRLKRNVCVFLRKNNTEGRGRVSFVMVGKPDKGWDFMGEKPAKGKGTRGRVDRACQAMILKLFMYHNIHTRGQLNSLRTPSYMTMAYLEVTMRCIPKYGAMPSKFTVWFPAASYDCQMLLTVRPVCGVPKNHQQFENISTRQ